MFSFFKKKTAPELAPSPAPATRAADTAAAPITTAADGIDLSALQEPAQKLSWMSRLKAGLSKTSANLSVLFVGAKIDDDLYEELESALLMADAGMDATQYLLDALKAKVKEDKLLDAAAVKAALKILMIDLLTPLQRPFELGRHSPMVMMISASTAPARPPPSASWPSTCRPAASRCCWPPATPSAPPPANS